MESVKRYSVAGKSAMYETTDGEWVVAMDFDRVTAEREALQLLLNNRDDLDDQLTSLEQRRYAEQQAREAAERRVEYWKDEYSNSSDMRLEEVAELLRVQSELTKARELIGDLRADTQSGYLKAVQALHNWANQTAPRGYSNIVMTGTSCNQSAPADKGGDS